MVCNEGKTNLIVVNGSSGDREKIVVGKVIVGHTTSYIYLGGPFTEAGNLSSVTDIHVKSVL